MTTTDPAFPIAWGGHRRDAGHYLAAASILGEHRHFQALVTLRHRDDGPDVIHDLDALEDFAWSSGERTLLGLFLGYAGFHRPTTVADILSLDEPNRVAAGNSVSMACAPARYLHPSMQSYDEAF